MRILVVEDDSHGNLRLRGRLRPGLAYIYLTKKDFSTYELPFGSFLGVSALLVSLWNR